MPSAPTADEPPPDPREAERQRVIDMAMERGELAELEDGFFAYWPNGDGCIAPHQLRWIADEIDRRNAAWSAEIDAYFDSLNVESIELADDFTD